jgi:hypothetical protein
MMRIQKIKIEKKETNIASGDLWHGAREYASLDPFVVVADPHAVVRLQRRKIWRKSELKLVALWRGGEIFFT